MPDKKMDLFATTLVCTTFCTLNCKNCLIKIPFQKKKHTDLELIKRSLTVFFELVDHVCEFTIMGGEAFLHPQFAQLMEWMEQYSARIDKLFLITQASYVPSEEAIRSVADSGCHCIVHIDDYGKLSPKLDEVIKILNQENIQFDVRHYNEKEQYYGGWVDVVGDFTYQNYLDGGADVYTRCKNKSNCKFIWDGVLYSCGMHGAGVKLGKVPLGPDDAIDLLDGRPLDEKSAVLSRMGTKPMEGCKYCRGWDVKLSPRIKAAIQLEKTER